MSRATTIVMITSVVTMLLSLALLCVVDVDSIVDFVVASVPRCSHSNPANHIIIEETETTFYYVLDVVVSVGSQFVVRAHENIVTLAAGSYVYRMFKLTTSLLKSLDVAPAHLNNTSCAVDSILKLIDFGTEYALETPRQIIFFGFPPLTRRILYSLMDVFVYVVLIGMPSIVVYFAHARPEPVVKMDDSDDLLNVPLPCLVKRRKPIPSVEIRRKCKLEKQLREAGMNKASSTIATSTTILDTPLRIENISHTHTVSTKPKAETKNATEEDPTSTLESNDAVPVPVLLSPPAVIESSPSPSFTVVVLPDITSEDFGSEPENSNSQTSPVENLLPCQAALTVNCELQFEDLGKSDVHAYLSSTTPLVAPAEMTANTPAFTFSLLAPSPATSTSSILAGTLSEMCEDNSNVHTTTLECSPISQAPLDLDSDPRLLVLPATNSLDELQQDVENKPTDPSICDGSENSLVMSLMDEIELSPIFGPPATTSDQEVTALFSSLIENTTVVQPNLEALDEMWSSLGIDPAPPSYDSNLTLEIQQVATEIIPIAESDLQALDDAWASLGIDPTPPDSSTMEMHLGTPTARTSSQEADPSPLISSMCRSSYMCEEKLLDVLLKSWEAPFAAGNSQDESLLDLVNTSMDLAPASASLDFLVNATTMTTPSAATGLMLSVEGEEYSEGDLLMCAEMDWSNNMPAKPATKRLRLSSTFSNSCTTGTTSGSMFSSGCEETPRWVTPSGGSTSEMPQAGPSSQPQDSAPEYEMDISNDECIDILSELCQGMDIPTNADPNFDLSELLSNLSDLVSGQALASEVTPNETNVTSSPTDATVSSMDVSLPDITSEDMDFEEWINSSQFSDSTIMDENGASSDTDAEPPVTPYSMPMEVDQSVETPTVAPMFVCEREKMHFWDSVMTSPKSCKTTAWS